MTRLPTVFTYEQEPFFERPHAASSTDDVVGGTGGKRPVAWELKRDPPRPHDLRLSPLAAQWMAALPCSLKPTSLSEQFPRIANRLAISWKDASLVVLVLDQLLSDRRAGRRGFPPDVHAELVRLALEVKARKTTADSR